MPKLPSDLAHFLAATRRRPAIALTCVLTLSLGVGASTAMFSVVESVLLRPLPYPDPDRLVSVYPTMPDLRGHPTLGFAADRGTWSWPEYFGVQERQRVFEQMAAYAPGGSMTLRADGPPEQIEVLPATWQLFPMLGVTPVVGRIFDAADRRESRVIVLSYRQWEGGFASDPGIVGRTITLNDDPYTIVGVLPEGFEVDGESPPMWTARTGSVTDGEIGSHSTVRSVARLADGVTIEQARDEIARLLQEVVPPDHDAHEASVYPRQQDETRLARPVLLVMLAASLLLLVVSCGNTAALLLGVGIDRERELAIRSAVGASRQRLIAQLVAESTVLGLVAGAGGILAAILLSEVLLLVAPQGVPGLEQAGLNTTVLGFAVLVSVVCGAVSGVIPALSLSSVHIAGAIGSSQRAVKARAKLHSTVVVGELALATLLVTSAMLLTRTVAELNSVGLGFDGERLALVSVGPPSRQTLEPEGVSTADARADRQRIVREEIAALPGVESVAVTAVPIGSFANNSVVPEGWDESRYPPVAERRLVSANFFEVAGIDIVEGRALEPQDFADGPTAIVVSEGLADLGWPNGSAIGSQIEYRGGQTGVVVGVAGNLRDLDLREPTALAFYAPGGDIGQMVIRVSGDPEALLPAIRERIRNVDPDVAILQATTFTDQIREEIAEERYRARLMTIFAVFATVLALMGIYGVTSRAVARRAKEMGVRLALGAKAVTVQRMVTLQAVRLGGLGVLAGLALSFAGWQVLERFIWGVSVADPLTLTVVILVFPAFAAAAALGPARRATRVNPLQVLRSE